MKRLGTIPPDPGYKQSRKAHKTGGWWLIPVIVMAFLAYVTAETYFFYVFLLFTSCAGFCFVSGFSIASAADVRFAASLEKKFKLKNVQLVGDGRFYASYEGKFVEGCFEKNQSGYLWVVIQTNE